jgi:hypothetical protein
MVKMMEEVIPEKKADTGHVTGILSGKGNKQYTL